MRRVVSVLICLLFLAVSCAHNTVSITSEPKGAKVRVDGNPIGETPCAFKDKTGSGRSYLFTLQKEGYKTLRSRHQVPCEGCLLNIHFSLQPIESGAAEPEPATVQKSASESVSSKPVVGARLVRKDQTTKATITRRATVYPRPSMAYVMLGIISSDTTISVKEETEKWVRFSSDGYDDAWVLKSHTDRAEKRHFRRGKER